MKRALLLIILTIPVLAQAPDRPVEETKKNIKTLKGLPTSSLIPVMAYMSNSLGVTCAHCHVKQWESDEKPAKETARKMIAMVRSINTANFDGKVMVSCNTCHRGDIKPVAIPLIQNAGWNKPATKAPETALPALDAVLAAQTRAIGNAPTAKRISRGTVTRMNGRDEPKSSAFEMSQELPSTVDMKTDLSYPPEANRELYRYYFVAGDPSRGYTSMKVVGREGATIVVEAQPKEGRTERLFFDEKSGLLARKYRELQTPIGILPEEYEYGDYRMVNGTMVPFMMQWSRADYRVTHRIESVE